MSRPLKWKPGWFSRDMFGCFPAARKEIRSYRTKPRRARKQHTCEGCGEPIPAGTRYTEAAYVHFGWCLKRWHEECHDAAVFLWGLGYHFRTGCMLHAWIHAWHRPSMPGVQQGKV